MHAQMDRLSKAGTWEGPRGFGTNTDSYSQSKRLEAFPFLESLMDILYNYTVLFLFHGFHMISWWKADLLGPVVCDSRRSTENCDLTDLPQRPAILHIPDDQPDTWWLPGEVTLGVAMG